jgi:hypothetical protein
MSTENMGTDLEATTLKDPVIVKYERKMRSSRRYVVIFAVIITLNTAAAIFVGQLYNQPSYSSGSSDISSAISNYKINDSTSTTVYNQMVANGWVAKDLLVAIGNQNATIIEQNSDAMWLVALLLFNILFTLGWIGISIIRLGFMRIDQNQHHFENSSK